MATFDPGLDSGDNYRLYCRDITWRSPLIEQEFRRSLAISVNDYSVFFTRPIALTLLALVAVSFILPVITHFWQGKSEAA